MSAREQRDRASALREWQQANEIIARAVLEWFPATSAAQAEAYAMAIQARLAHAGLFVCCSKCIDYAEHVEGCKS